MKIAIIINRERLNSALKEKLEGDELKKKHDIDYDLFIIGPNELEQCIKSLNYQTYNACLVGGGDGTVRTAALILADNNLPLIILPLGTFNVLATSLGYPNDIDEIFEIIKNKKTKEIDLAEVNDVGFINHAWLGVYYDILKFRKRYKGFFKKNKLFKILLNTFWIFKNVPIYKFKLNVNDESTLQKTCLIFISNNETSSEWDKLGQRPFLATGLLSVSILNCHTRLQVLQCMISLIFSNLKNSKWIHHFSVDELEISSSNQKINIVLDGELFHQNSPLHFVNRKNKLTVLIA